MRALKSVGLRSWAVAGLLLALACSDETFSSDDGSLVASAADSADQATAESGIMIVAAQDASDTASAEEVAAAAAARAAQDYSPASCESATATGPEVTYTLNNCSGPYGLVNVTGELVAVFSRVDGGLQIATTGTNMSVNQATVDLQAVGVYSRTGDEEELVVTTQTSGVTRRQATLSRTGTYTATWNQTTGCVGLGGTWNTAVDAITWTTTITGYERCGAGCPAAGGTITYSNQDETTFTVSYDGDDTANWANTRGRTGTMPLVCTP